MVSHVLPLAGNRALRGRAHLPNHALLNHALVTQIHVRMLRQCR